MFLARIDHGQRSFDHLNRSMHVQERPGRAAASCLCPPSSLEASRRIVFMSATMSSFSFRLGKQIIRRHVSPRALRSHCHYHHRRPPGRSGDTRIASATKRTIRQSNGRARPAARAQELLASELCAPSTYTLSQKRRLHHPVHTGSSLRRGIARPSSLMRRRHSFMTTATSASPAFPMVAPAAWKSARALRSSFALRCVASSFPMLARAT